MSDYISQDLLVLILKRLPVKILLRFKCVCKSWKQLIDSTSFTLQHLHLTSQSPRFILTGVGNTNLKLLDPRMFPSVSDFDTVTIPDRTEGAVFVSTCHGIICYMDALALLVVLWNPLTRQLFRFPLPCRGTAYKYYRSFWIDPSNNEFKVVTFNLKEGENVALYSSRKRAWMEVGMDLDIIGNNYNPDGLCVQVMVDGVAYWRAYYLGLPIIVFFDFGQDKFGTIELPFSAPQKYINVCKWRGFLSVVHWNNELPNRCDSWVMQNGVWSKMFSFNLVTRFKEILCVLESCGCRVLALIRNRDTVLCDPNASSCAYVTLEKSYNNQRIVSYEFVESLVSPDPKCISII